MSKLIDDSVRDNGLVTISAGATTLHICPGDPADRAAAIAASLGNVVPTFTGPTGSGTRVLAWDQKTNIPVSAGDASTLCTIDATVLQHKTDITGAPVAIAGTVTVNSYTLTSGAVT